MLSVLRRRRRRRVEAVRGVTAPPTFAEPEALTRILALPPDEGLLDELRGDRA